jgi:hypothetical protein
MKIGIAAIFKNEYPYIIEWLAYHRLIGVTHFFIADNVSNDGSSELLQALDDLGYITRLHHPRVDDKGPQASAYNRILKKFGKQVDVMGFIDADEFVVVQDEMQLKTKLQPFLDDSSYGALALNWRIFGSSHHRLMPDGPVVENFTLRAPDDFKFNKHIKSFVKPSCVDEIYIHHARLKKACYATTSMQMAEFDDSSARTLNTDFNNLYINHYVVKSRIEHFVNKAKKGSAAGSAKREKGRDYFLGHDINTVKDSSFSPELMARLHSEIQSIKLKLNYESQFMNYKKAHVTIRNNALSGWISLDEGEKAVLRVIRGQDEILIKCDHDRPDVVKKGLSKNPACGFHRGFVHPISPENITVYLLGSSQQFEVNR